MPCTIKNIYKPPNDTSLKIGDTKEIPGMCVKDPTQGKNYAKLYLPNGGEYEYGGTGNTCYRCMWDSGVKETTCSSGCVGFASCCTSPIPGKKVLIRRKAYNGRKSYCCLKPDRQTFMGQTSLTCDPSFDGTNPECNTVMQSSCGKTAYELDNYEPKPEHKNKAIMFRTDKDGLNLGAKKCNAWCLTYPEACKTVKTQICSDPTKFKNNKNKCLDFCYLNPGKCDKAMFEYCKTPEGKLDPKCSCINSDINKTKYNPLCVDSKCIRNGYATNSQLVSRGGGCRIVDCSVVMDINAGGNVEFDDVKVVQNCQMEAAAKDADKAIEQYKPTNSEENTQTNVLIFIGILVVLAITAIIIAIVI